MSLHDERMQILSMIQNGQVSVLQQLKESTGLALRINKFLHNADNLPERLESVYIEIKDIARETEILNDRFFHDPERLGKINERLTLIFDLLAKHRLSGVNELITLHGELKKKIESTGNADFNLESLKQQITSLSLVLHEKATELNKSRNRVIPVMEKQISVMLQEVGMPNAAFKINLQPLNVFGEEGADSIQFLFTANKNTSLQDISRVASGGEMSRLMLCIKSFLSGSTGLPSIIFDEIDSGVSGETAERVGNIIKRMSAQMQIINITHLPQVASKGNFHYLVYKTEEENTTVTRIKLLSPEERLLEIAKMLSGEEITNAAMENARALLGN